MAEEEPRPDDAVSGDPPEAPEQPDIGDTAEQRAVDVPAVFGTPEPSAPDVGPSGTSVLPTVTDSAPESPRWSARARVRSPDVDDVPVHSPDWEAEPPPRGVLVPALIGICVLLLAALIGLGIWLVLRNRDSAPVTPPTGTQTVGPTSPVPPTTVAATQTTAPSTAAAAEVAIPELRGSAYEAAAAALSALGFLPNRVDEANNDVPAGQVIATDPPARTMVRPGARINVIMSTGPTKPPTPTGGPTTPPPA